MIYKVKEIFPEEFKYLRDDIIIFTYIHSNAHKDQTEALMASKCVSIAFEDVSSDNPHKRWPLVANMGELAGKGGFLAALHFSQSVHGGKGLLLNRIPGVPTPEITILGCGASGMGVAELAAAFGNKVTILDAAEEGDIRVAGSIRLS